MRDHETIVITDLLQKQVDELIKINEWMAFGIDALTKQTRELIDTTFRTTPPTICDEFAQLEENLRDINATWKEAESQLETLRDGRGKARPGGSPPTG